MTKNIDNHFNEISEYDAEIPKHIREYLAKKKTSLILNAISSDILCSEPQKILDIGCGTGWHIKTLEEYSNHIIYGTDSSFRQVEQAKKNTGNLNISIGDVLSLDYDDNFFD